MINDTKVFRVLKHLSKTELNRLDKFVLSPYFNSNDHITSLHEAMRPILDKSAGVEKVKVWQSVFGSPKYNDRKFRKLCSDYLSLVERFLAQETYEDNRITQIRDLTEQIALKRINPIVNSTRRSANRILDKTAKKSASYYLSKYQLAKSFNSIEDYELNRTIPLNFQEADYNLDLFYFSEKLNLHCLLLSQRNITGEINQISFIDEIIERTQDNRFSAVPNIEIFKLMAGIYEDPTDEVSYIKLKERIQESIDLFPDLEARDIFYAAVNFCIKQINKGSKKYLREIFELYDFALGKEFIYIHGELTPWTFKNIVVVALRLKEYEWCEKFISYYQLYLNDDVRDNAVAFNLARLNWYKQDHDEVIRLLLHVEFDDISYALGAKAMLLATYYETDEIEALYSLMDSFRVFLNRNKNKMPEQRRHNYLNLIKYLKKLTKIHPRETEKINKLREEIEIKRDIADRSWLLSKVDELA